MAVEQQVGLGVVAFLLVDLGLGPAMCQWAGAWWGRGREFGRRTSFCMVLAVRSQADRGMWPLYV